MARAVWGAVLGLALAVPLRAQVQQGPGDVKKGKAQPRQETQPASPERGLLQEADMDRQLVERIIRDWPMDSRNAARSMLEKYGAPDEAALSLLLWNNNGSWKRTIVYKDEVEHSFPRPHKDVIEQFVDSRVPVDKADELLRFDGSLRIDRTRGELACRSDREEHNVLALNLADEIVRGERTVEDARGFFARTVAGTAAGRVSDFVDSLKFNILPGTSDADKQMMEEPVPEEGLHEGHGPLPEEKEPVQREPMKK